MAATRSGHCRRRRLLPVVEVEVKVVEEVVVVVVVVIAVFLLPITRLRGEMNICPSRTVAAAHSTAHRNITHVRLRLRLGSDSSDSR